MNILFAKSNLQRKNRFRIDTIIYEKKDKIIVRKYIDNLDAQTHFRQFAENIKTIKQKSKNIYFPKTINHETSFLEIEYLNLPSLESLIEKSLMERCFNQSNTYISLLKRIVDNIESIYTCPYNNNEFRLNFDPQNKYCSKKIEDCCRIGILDVDFDNVLLDKNDKLFLLDCEWVFDFAIPKNYLQFRALFYLCNRLQSVIATYCSNDFPCYEVLRYFLMPIKWFDQLGLSQKEVEKYLYFEHTFQHNIQLFGHKFDQTRVLEKKRILRERYSLSLENYLFMNKDEKGINPKLLYLIRHYRKLKSFLFKK